MGHKKQKRIFICGTNTDVGKTFIGNIVVREMIKKTETAIFKPIETGCILRNGRLIPNDSSIYFKALKERIPLDIINPFRFRPPISPKRAITLSRKIILIKDVISKLKSFSQYDYLLIEGAGGVCSPLTLDGLNIDLMKKINGQALLIAKDEIGVINSVLLTISILRKYRIPLLAIVLNRIEKSQPDGMNNKLELNEYIKYPIIQIIKGEDNSLPLKRLVKILLA